MGLLGGGQGQDLIHNRLETTGSNQVEDREEIALGTHGRAEDLELTEEDVTQISARVPAAGGAAGHYAPAAREREDELGPDLGPHVLEDDVDAALAGQALDLGDEILRRVVDGL